MPAPFPEATGKPPLWFRFVSLFTKTSNNGTPAPDGGTQLKDCTVMVQHRAETSTTFPDGSPIVDSLITKRYVDKPRLVDWRTLGTIPEIDIWDYHRDLRQKMLYTENHRESPDFPTGPPPSFPASSQEFYMRKLKVVKNLIITGVFWNDHYNDNFPVADRDFNLEWTWAPNMPGDVGTHVFPGLFDPAPSAELFAGGGVVSANPSNDPFGAVTIPVTPAGLAAAFAGIDRSLPAPATAPGDYIFKHDTYVRDDLDGTEGTIGAETFTFTPETGAYSRVSWGAKQIGTRASFEEFRDRGGQRDYYLKTDGTVSLTFVAGATHVPAKAVSQDYQDRLFVVVEPEVDVPVKAVCALNYRAALNDKMIGDGEPNPPVIFLHKGAPAEALGKLGDYYINTSEDPQGAAVGGIGTSWYGPKPATIGPWGAENTTAFPAAVREEAKKYKDTRAQVLSAIYYDYDHGDSPAAYFFESDSRAVAVMAVTSENPEIPLFVPLDPDDPENFGMSGNLSYFVSRPKDFRIMGGGRANSNYLESYNVHTFDGDEYNEFHYTKDALPSGWYIGVYLPPDDNYPIGGAGGENADDTTRVRQPEGYEPFSRPVRSNPVIFGSGIYYYPYVDDASRGRPIFDQKIIEWRDWKGDTYNGVASRYVIGYFYVVSYELSPTSSMGGEPASLIPFQYPA